VYCFVSMAAVTTWMHNNGMYVHYLACCTWVPTFWRDLPINTSCYHITEVYNHCYRSFFVSWLLTWSDSATSLLLGHNVHFMMSLCQFVYNSATQFWFDMLPLADMYGVVDCTCFFSNGICTVDALEKLISWILTSYSDSVNPRIQNLFSKTNEQHNS
jgi:hypothetical protein